MLLRIQLKALQFDFASDGSLIHSEGMNCALIAWLIVVSSGVKYQEKRETISLILVRT